MTKPLLSRVAGRIFNTPLMIHPAKLDAIIAGLAPRLVGHDIDIQPEAIVTQVGDRSKPGYRVIDGLGVIDIFGVLAHRNQIDADSSFVLGYETIARGLDAALSDPGVSGILLNIDSPGGEVSGAFDLAERIFAARAIKPIHAVASDLATSAAYLLASAADTVTITETGYAGSVGVVMRHVDLSQMIEDDGLKITYIFAGAKKIDGNPFEPLPERVRDHFQQEINAVYDLFVARVAQYRDLSQALVRETEAGIFLGQAAVDAGLADFVSVPDAVLAGFGDLTSQQTTSSGGTSMITKTTAKAEDKSKAKTTAAQPTEEKIDMDALARAEGYEAGQADERERIAGILNHAEAEGREAQAKALALETDLSVEEAGKVLAVSPSTAPQAPEPKNAFTEHMQALGNPSVGADNGDSTEAEESQAIQTGWARAFGQRLN